jgi:erythromycin esterase-like protein
VNRFVKDLDDAKQSARDVLQTFVRWPSWMWANEEVADLLTWLREFNRNRPEVRKIGFYGLDVYSLWNSLYAVMSYLRRSHPEALPAAWRAYRCFEPYAEDVQDYARAAQFVPDSCESEVVELLRKLRHRTSAHPEDNEADFDAEQNAIVLKNAETYYRTMVRGGAASWNVRDRHMTETLERLMQHHGGRAKGIVWAHNTHIGDARFTDMVDGGEINLGQLVREQHAQDGVVLVGFGCYRGSVIAGRRWDAPMQPMNVPPARAGSWEDVLHGLEPRDKLLLFTEPPTPEMLEPRGHRAIGVVYRPEYESRGNYVPTVLARRYDAFLFLDSTEALHPLGGSGVPVAGEAPETFPSGV